MYGVRTVQRWTPLTPWKSVFMDHFPCVGKEGRREEGGRKGDREGKNMDTEADGENTYIYREASDTLYM